MKQEFMASTNPPLSSAPSISSMTCSTVLPSKCRFLPRKLLVLWASQTFGWNWDLYRALQIDRSPPDGACGTSCPPSARRDVNAGPKGKDQIDLILAVDSPSFAVDILSRTIQLYRRTTNRSPRACRAGYRSCSSRNDR